MDNNQRSGTHQFLQALFNAHPHIGQAVHQIVHSFAPHAPLPSERLPVNHPDLAHMPPSERIPSGSAPEAPDREMTPVEDIARDDQDPSTLHDAPAVASSQPPPQQDAAPSYEANGPAPSLQPASSSSADIEMHDDEARESNGTFTPTSEPQPRSTRRARVDDEEDEEDSRETNRQRMHSPNPSDSHAPRVAPQGAQPQTTQPPQPDTPPGYPPPPYNGVIYTIDFFPPPPPGDAQGHDDTHGHHHHHHHPAPPMFNFTFQIPFSPSGSAPATGANDAHPGAPPIPDFAQLFGAPGDGVPVMFPFFPFGIPRDTPHDDPERAERLIRGLEPVTPSLLQRLEQISGDSGDACCSICFDKLTAEGGGFEMESSESQSDAGPTSEQPDDASRERTPSRDASESSIPKDLPRVVTLPCSHVYHTACLFPWFTKPGRTTCPSCRFDIDPDSLTYVPPRQRRARRTQSSQRQPDAQPTQAPAAQPAEAQAQPAPQPQAQPEAAPQAHPAPNTVPNGQERGFRPIMIPLEFSFFFPIGPGAPPPPPSPGPGAGAEAGAAPQPPENWTRLFGPPPPLHASANVGTASAGQQGSNPPNTDEAGQDRWFELLTGRPAAGSRTDAPSASANAAAGGAVPQRPPMTSSRSQGRPRPPEKRQWTPPAPPGLTLRQRVERRERELGLRCWDVSCGLGPSDEDPVPVIDPAVMRQVAIRPLGSADANARVCEHTFHPSCLVSAERVAGWGAEDKTEEKEGEEVQVSCPVCRAVGAISRTDWDEGACALA
ncbi:hypothetical protein WOLCODRAFT_136508 [Wolfiporia cocos MD-104 SS10]|uniref:RING-type domain-containing protein n=1 Tax=Wolfiporia cocos (strain MD-104) TaxID=742152 RepID=A0A2H3JD64_WOLCO|nr:hypothetical protein WOLCODRAFT_136508 [Wolfiporia cocos MD-104 SS10]